MKNLKRHCHKNKMHFFQVVNHKYKGQDAAAKQKKEDNNGKIGH